MLASICPLGERARRQRYAVTIAAFVVASVGAGTLLGGALGFVGEVALGGVEGSVLIACLGALAAFGLVLDRRSRSAGHVPGPRRQVNEDWLTVYRGWVYGGGFGAQLGAGVTTFVMVSAVYVVFLAAALAGSVAGGMLIGAVFGLARAVPVLVTSDVIDGATLRSRIRRLEGWRPVAHRAVLITQASVVIVATALVLA